MPCPRVVSLGNPCTVPGQILPGLQSRNATKASSEIISGHQKSALVVRSGKPMDFSADKTSVVSAEKTSVVPADKISVVSADKTSVVPLDKTSVVSADNRCLVC